MGIPSGNAIQVVYAVDLPPEAAAQLWLDAHGRRYDLPRSAGLTGQVVGGAGEVGVQLEFGDGAVVVVGNPTDYRSPPAGATVVTVVVNGRVE